MDQNVVPAGYTSADCIILPVPDAPMRPAISREKNGDSAIEHDLGKAAGEGAAITKQWASRLQQLAGFMGENRRPPFATGHGADESSLGRWLEKQRADALKGTLSEGKRLALDETGDWMCPPRVHLDQRRWNDRLEELAAFVESESRLPSYRHTSSKAERVLGNWLHTQRRQAYVNSLRPEKLRALNERVPGWNTWKSQQTSRR